MINMENKDIKKVSRKLLQKLNKNIVLVFLLFLCLDLIFGVFFFWYYDIRVEKKIIERQTPLRLNQGLLNNFSSSYQEKQENYFQIAEKNYKDCFKAFFVEE